MKKLICFIVGHRKAVKVQMTQGYGMFICDRCNSVFAEKKEIADAKNRKREEKQKKVSMSRTET